MPDPKETEEQRRARHHAEMRARMDPRERAKLEAAFGGGARGKESPVIVIGGDRLPEGLTVVQEGAHGRVASTKPTETDLGLPKLASPARIPSRAELAAQRVASERRAPRREPTLDELSAMADKKIAEVRGQTVALDRAQPAVRPREVEEKGVPEWLRRYMESQRTSNR